MRFSKAWIIASKDFKTFKRKKSIIYTLVGFVAFVSIALPIVIRYVVSKATGAADISTYLPGLINSFSFWFVIGAGLLPAGIASYSLIGEKVQKSLEPLLATPTTDSEILFGKSIAAFIPTIASLYIGSVIFMFLTDLFTHSYIGYLLYPNWTIAIMLLIMVPLACIFSVAGNILVSSRVNDVRTAQQLGSLLFLPLIAIYVLAEIGIFKLNLLNVLIIAAVLLAATIGVFYLAKATFQREEILTRWK